MFYRFFTIKCIEYTTSRQQWNKKITLSKYCILGTNAVVIPEAEFGEGCVIGSQSLVSSKLKSWHIYYGVPIRALAKRSKSFLKKKKLKYK